MHQRELEHAEIYPTWGCNLNCPTCVQKQYPDRYPGMLSLDQWYHFLLRLQEQKIHLKSLEFNGGEATTWPHFRQAREDPNLHRLVDRVCCITNGVYRHGKDYEGIDLVRMTDYGAINRKYILRLRKELGRKRFIHSRVVHREAQIWPTPVAEKDGWPAICSSPAITLGPDALIYPCGNACIEQRDGISLDKPWATLLRNMDPRRQERCLSCASNQRIWHGQYGDAETLGLTLECGVWGTPIGLLLNLPWLHWWRWRHLWSRYYRKGMR